MSDSYKSQSQMRTLVTDEFRDHYEQTFGAVKPKRGRWVQDPSTGKLIPAEEYVPPHVDERVPVLTDLYMDGVRATDGTDIGSRAKRRAYMRANNLADADDFKQTWAREQQEREAFRTGKRRDPAVREALGRALHEARRKR